MPILTPARPVITEEPKLALLAPGEPAGEAQRTLEDARSNASAGLKKATQGDKFAINLFERPFSSGDMIYRPDLDIITVDFEAGEGFFFFTIRLYGPNQAGGKLMGVYGIEFDRTFNGRGDLLVTAQSPSAEWSTEGVAVYEDLNKDIGGPNPREADYNFKGNGYDSAVEMSADRSAWARLDPDDESAVQIAVSYALVETADQYLWGAWADDGLKNPAKFDYNDAMSQSAAGSPLAGNDYPLKALFNLDNTCRLPYGAGQASQAPGMCKIGGQRIENLSGCRPVCLRMDNEMEPPRCVLWGTVCD